MSAEQAAKPWPEIDPADWEPEPPAERRVDVRLACLLGAQRIMHHRVARLARAQSFATKAIDALVATTEAVDEAADLVLLAAADCMPTETHHGHP